MHVVDNEFIEKPWYRWSNAEKKKA